MSQVEVAEQKLDSPTLHPALWPSRRVLEGVLNSQNPAACPPLRLSPDQRGLVTWASPERERAGGAEEQSQVE